jgi:hypothetical protein
MKTSIELWRVIIKVGKRVTANTGKKTGFRSGLINTCVSIFWVPAFYTRRRFGNALFPLSDVDTFNQKPQGKYDFKKPKGTNRGKERFVLREKHRPKILNEVA